MAETTRLSWDDAEGLVREAFTAHSVPGPVAISVARALVAAEAEGQMGHGFTRVPDYVAQVRTGKIRAEAEPTLTETGPAALGIDAGFGFAYPALDLAIEAGIARAREMGIAVMTIRNSHHCGALSMQVERFADAGLLGLMVANAPKAIAPWGAKSPLFGTNPIAFASPQAEGPPLVIDLSLSVVARGKVMAAKKAGEPIPEGWALDADGAPTTDPDAAMAGTMVPIGGPKGTALALMVEILAGALSGSGFSHEATSFFSAEGDPPCVGQTLIAIAPGPQSDYLARVRVLLDLIADMPGARLPGARRRAALEQSRAHGLSVPTRLVEIVRDLARGS